MNPIDQCFQKISPGNHFSYVRDRTYGTYVRTYGCTDKADAICPPPPILNGGGIINHVAQCKTSKNCVGQVAFVFKLPLGQVEISGLFLTLKYISR